MPERLPRKHQTRRPPRALDRGLPRHRRFHRVARPPHLVAGDVAQGRQMFDRLMGRAVLAQTDGVVGVDVDCVRRDQRAHAHGVARVVGKHQEGGVIRNEPAVQRHAVADGGHAELAHAVIDIVALPVGTVAGGGIQAALPLGEIGSGQIRRAADQFRQQWRERVQGHLRSLARGHVRAVLLQPGDIRRGLLRPVRGQLAGQAATELGGQFGVRGGVGIERGMPLPLALRAGGARIPAITDGIGDLERGVVPTQLHTRRGDFVLAQRGAVAAFLTLLVGRAKTDHGARADQGGPLVLRGGCVQRAGDRVRVVAVDVADDIPAIGLKARGAVVGEPATHLAVDGDAVVVIHRHQLAQLPGAGQRGHFVGDAFHQAAVAEEHIGAVIDDCMTRAVEARGQHLFRQREAHRVGQALTQRAGGSFHARGMAVFGVAGGARVQLAEALELIQRQVVAGQVQQRVLQHGAVAVGQHEAVAVEPLGIGRVVPEEIVPYHLGNVGHAHRHARVAGVGRFHGVHGKGSHGIGKLAAGGHEAVSDGETTIVADPHVPPHARSPQCAGITVYALISP